MQRLLDWNGVDGGSVELPRLDRRSAKQAMSDGTRVGTGRAPVELLPWKTVLDALAGDPQATRTLVDRFTPVIQREVALALLRYSSASARKRNPRQEVEDITQEVFVALMENDGRVLRAWDPARGRTLRSFIGLVARREVASILRSGKRNPWTEDPTLTDEISNALEPDAATPEILYSSRELMLEVSKRVAERLSVQGHELFQLVVLEGATVDEVASLTGLSKVAVYKWRERLAQLVKTIAAEVCDEQAVGRR